MSRSRFMLLPFHRLSASPAGRAGPAIPPPALAGRTVLLGPGARPVPGAARARRPVERRRSAGTPFLALTAAAEPGPGEALAKAVLSRVCRPDPVAGTVILILGEAPEFDLTECAALCAVRDTLAECGAKLLVVATSRQGRDQLATLGPPHLGADAVHQSLRSAILAVYASLPGPGLVTADVRAALARPPEPLTASPGEAETGRAVSASPAEGGAPATAGWWTESSPGSTA